MPAFTKPSISTACHRDVCDEDQLSRDQAKSPMSPKETSTGSPDCHTINEPSPNNSQLCHIRPNGDETITHNRRQCNITVEKIDLSVSTDSTDVERVCVDNGQTSCHNAVSTVSCISPKTHTVLLVVPPPTSTSPVTPVLEVVSQTFGVDTEQTADCGLSEKSESSNNNDIELISEVNNVAGKASKLIDIKDELVSADISIVIKDPVDNCDLEMRLNTESEVESDTRVVATTEVEADVDLNEELVSKPEGVSTNADVKLTDVKSKRDNDTSSGLSIALEKDSTNDCSHQSTKKASKSHKSSHHKSHHSKRHRKSSHSSSHHKNDSSQIKSESSHHKNDSSQIKSESSHHKNDSSQIKSESSHHKNDSSQIKSESSHHKNDSSQIKSESSHHKNDSSQIKSESSHHKNDSSQIKSESSHNKSDFQRSKTESTHNKSDSLQQKSSSQKNKHNASSKGF